jgi:O-antigen ligase
MILNKIYVLQKYSAYLIPIALIFSVFIADLSVVILSITFLIYQLKIKGKKIFYNKIFIFFLIFWLYLVFNSFLSYDIETSISRSLPYLRFGFLFLALSSLLEDDEFKHNFLKLVLFSLLFLCFDAIFQYLIGFNLVGYERHASRVSSFFHEELVMGSFLLKMYPIFLISLLTFKKKNLVSNKIFVIFIIIYFFCIYISGGRTALFNFILFNLILSLIFYRKKYLKYTFILLLFVPSILLISNSVNPNTAQRYQNLEIFDQKRLVLFSKTYENHYISAYRIFKSNPIFGSGLKSFRKICLKPRFNPVGCATHPHNIFMHFLSELGLIGTFFYLFSFLYFGIKILRIIFDKFIKQKNNKKSQFEIILIISIFVSLSPFSPSGSFFNNWMSILNFLSIAFYVHFKKDY